ncbi:hypothetical protein [Desulfogranum japonicum]|uniref:hypothetical protein n=1 Tax=Desulfogranum japonicum TaxID=231447 RepID=UPI00048E620C|nr:hypothetical protein [Desulfogranum japonicum]
MKSLRVLLNWGTYLLFALSVEVFGAGNASPGVAAHCRVVLTFYERAFWLFDELSGYKKQGTKA